jgi:hypothetical protein
MNFLVTKVASSKVPSKSNEVAWFFSLQKLRRQNNQNKQNTAKTALPDLVLRTSCFFNWFLHKTGHKQSLWAGITATQFYQDHGQDPDHGDNFDTLKQKGCQLKHTDVRIHKLKLKTV